MKPVGPEISLKVLTLRVNFLLCILSGQYCQTIYHLRIDHMELREEKCTFFIIDEEKQSRVGHHVKPEKCGIFLSLRNSWHSLKSGSAHALYSLSRNNPFTPS